MIRTWNEMQPASSSANPTAKICRDKFPLDPSTTCTWWGVSPRQGDEHGRIGRHYSNWKPQTLQIHNLDDEYRYRIEWEYPDLTDYSRFSTYPGPCITCGADKVEMTGGSYECLSDHK